jgi:hypothetical protein
VTPSPADVAFAAAASALELFREKLTVADDGSDLVLEAARAVYDSLLTVGVGRKAAQETARRMAVEAARCQPDGRGIVVRRRQWMKP